jgi:hypothetical protein
MQSKVEDRLRERIKEHIESTNTVVVDENRPGALVRGPVELNIGTQKFIDIEDLPDFNSLPYISEKLREFAFRYATEYKPVETWAKEYGVSRITVQKWLRNTAVRQYIAMAQMERRMFNLARRVSLESKVFKRLSEFLELKITGDNAGAIARMTEFAYNILHDPSNADNRMKGTFNVNIGLGSTPSQQVSISSDEPRQVTPPNDKQMMDMQKRLDQLRLVQNISSEDAAGDK